MILTRDPESRRVAARILLLQATTTVVLAVACLAAFGARQAQSALAGGGIGLAANAAMTVFALRETRTAGGALVRLVIGQFVKVGLTVALFVIAARTGKMAWPPFLAAYVATLLAFWAAPLWWARGARAAMAGSGQGQVEQGRVKNDVS